MAGILTEKVHLRIFTGKKTCLDGLTTIHSHLADPTYTLTYKDQTSQGSQFMSCELTPGLHETNEMKENQN